MLNYRKKYLKNWPNINTKRILIKTSMQSESNPQEAKEEIKDMEVAPQNMKEDIPKESNEEIIDTSSSFLNKKRERSPSPEKKEEIKTELSSEPEIIQPDIFLHLVSFDVFKALQKVEISQEKLEEEYKKYQSSHFENKLEMFYKEHKNDEWFKELYDPLTIESTIKETHSQCQRLYYHFESLLVSTNNYSSLSLNLSPTDKEKMLSNPLLKLKYHLFKPNEETLPQTISTEPVQDIIDISKSPYYAFNPEDFTVFLNEIPKTISRAQILSAITNSGGDYLSVSMSSPNRMKNHSRYCWITYTKKEQCEAALETLKECKITDDFMIFPYLSKCAANRYVRITPQLFEDRLQEDNEYLKKIISILNKEKELEENKIVNSTITSLEINKQNDIMIMYLRHVHGFCYYCVEEHDGERNLAKSCDCIHLREEGSLGKRSDAAQLDQEKNKEAIEFDAKLTERIKAFIGKKENKKKEDYTEKLNVLKEEFINNQIQTVTENEKYQCVICGKFFKGSEYVKKHILNKHSDLIKENVEDDFYEKIKKDNYFNTRKENNSEEHNIINTIEEYKEIVENKAQRKKMKYNKETNEETGEKSITALKQMNEDERNHNRRQYKDYDSVENRKEKENKNISYDDL